MTDIDQPHPSWCGLLPSCSAYPAADADVDPQHRSKPLVVELQEDIPVLVFISSAPARTYYDDPAGPLHLPESAPTVEIEQHRAPVDLTGDWWRVEPYQALTYDPPEVRALVAALLVTLALLDPDFPPTGGIPR